MIKSSDKQFNNTYRILRVLQNQDLLAIDTIRQHYIFAEYHNPQQQKNLPSLSASQKSTPSHIIHYEQLIVVDGLSYLVFRMPAKQIIWSHNIETNRLKQHKFRFMLVKQALSNILDQLLWLGTTCRNNMLNTRNFLLIADHLYFILIPRNHKNVVSLRRKEQSRSFSSDLSIGSIMQREQNMVKDFCLLVWEMLQKSPFNRQKIDSQGDFCKSLLSDLITQRITLETALQRIKAIQQKSSLMPEISRSVKFGQNQIIWRRATIDSSSMFRPRKKTYFQRFNQNAISKQFKTEVVTKLKKYSCPQRINRTEVIQTQSINNPLKYKRRNLSFQIQKPQVSFKTPRKSNNNTLTIFNPHKSLSCSSEKQKTQVINVLRSNETKKYETTNIESIMQNQTKVALMKFQLSRSDTASASYFKQKQQKLKEKLLQKVIKLKMQRFQKKVQTQQSFTNASILPIQSQFKQHNVHEKQRDIQESEKKEQSLAAKTQFIVKSRSSIDQNSKNSQPKQHEIQLKMPVQPVQVQVEKKMNIEKQSKLINQNREVISVADLKGLQKPQSDSNQFKREKYAAEKVKQSYNLNFNQDQFQSQIQMINLQPKFKTKTNKEPPNNQPVKEKNKMQSKARGVRTKDQFQNIETIYLQPQKKIPTINPPLQKQANKNTKPITENDKQEKINHVQLLINQFFGFVNILGDITASAIKNKQKLAQLQWRKSVYFLYQRFYYERTKLLRNLKAQKREIIRKNRRVTEEQWKIWNENEARKRMIAQMETQNGKLGETFKKFVQKLSKQSDLQQSLKQFISNWQKILYSRSKGSRKVISKYGGAIIINEYDRAKQKKLQTTDSIHFLMDCLFGLRILAELDQLGENQKPLDLSNYKKYDQTEEEIDSQVEELYQLFYDEGDEPRAQT